MLKSSIASSLHRVHCSLRVVHIAGPCRQRLHLLIDRRREVLKERLGVDAEDNSEEHQRRGNRQFASRQWRQCLLVRT